MKSLPKKIYNFISKAFIYFIGWFFGGIVIGLGTMITIVFSIYGFIYAFIIVILFLPFHWTDLKDFYINKNWLGFFGRLLILYLIGSYIGGFIAYRSGLLELPTNEFAAWTFIIMTVISWVGILFFVALITFFSDSNLIEKIKQIRRGLEKIGVLWF